MFDLKFSARRVSNFLQAPDSLHINKKDEQTTEDTSFPILILLSIPAILLSQKWLLIYA